MRCLELRQGVENLGTGVENFDSAVAVQEGSERDAGKRRDGRLRQSAVARAANSQRLRQPIIPCARNCGKTALKEGFRGLRCYRHSCCKRKCWWRREVLRTPDPKIREALRERIQRERGGEEGTLIRSEMAVAHGAARIDVAVINHSFVGYAYKGQRDPLENLPGQVSAFRGIFDRVAVVADPLKLERVRNIVPEWWGLEEVRISLSGEISFVEVRACQENPDYDDYALAQLLWRDEAVAVLRAREIEVGRSDQRCAVLWSMLVEHLALDELREEVRERLKSRSDWAGNVGGRERRVGRSSSSLSFV